MKINEIIVEQGILSTLRTKVLGAPDAIRNRRTQKQLTGEAGRLYQAFTEILDAQGVNPLDPANKDFVAGLAKKSALAYGKGVVGFNGEAQLAKFIEKFDIFNQPITDKILKDYFTTVVRVAQELTSLTPKVSAAQLNEPGQIYRITDHRTGRTFFKLGQGVDWWEYLGTAWPSDWRTAHKISPNDKTTLDFITQSVAAGGVKKDPIPKQRATP